MSCSLCGDARAGGCLASPLWIVHLACIKDVTLVPAEAEWVDTTGWYDKVKEARREVGAPDFDQVGMLLLYDKIVKPETSSNATSSEGSPVQQALTCKKRKRYTLLMWRQFVIRGGWQLTR